MQQSNHYGRYERVIKDLVFKFHVATVLPLGSATTQVAVFTLDIIVGLSPVHPPEAVTLTNHHLQRCRGQVVITHPNECVSCPALGVAHQLHPHCNPQTDRTV